MREPVVLDDVKASELPNAWRRRVKAKADERLTVTIARRGQDPWEPQRHLRHVGRSR